MNNIIKRKWNQNSMVIIEDLQGMAFQAESGGHTFQISGIDGEGNTVALSGTPAGVMLRSDGQDVTLTCSVSGGVVSATLPANAYSVPGRFGLTIFLTSDGQKTAIYAAVGTVGKTSSGTVAPPAGSDVVTLVNQINAAIAAIPVSYNSSFAPAYSTSGLYSVGQYVTYNGNLYRCNTAITTAETWTAAHWTQTNIGADVYDLKSAIIDSNKNVGIDVISGFNHGAVTASMTPAENNSYKYIIFERNAHGNKLYNRSETEYKILFKISAFDSSKSRLVTSGSWEVLDNGEEIDFSGIYSSYPSTYYIGITVCYSTTESVSNIISNVPLDDMYLSDNNIVITEELDTISSALRDVKIAVDSDANGNFIIGQAMNSIVPTSTSNDKFKCITIDLDTISDYLRIYNTSEYNLFVYISVFDSEGNKLFGSSSFTEFNNGDVVLRESYSSYPLAKYGTITYVLSETDASGAISLKDLDDVFLSKYDTVYNRLNSLEAEKQSKIYDAVVDVNGNGDYTTIGEAINNTSDGDTILILPGRYNGTVRMWGKNRILIGLDRDNCIIYSGSGLYNYPAMEANIGIVKNLTIISGNDDELSEDTTDSKAYAIHIEHGETEQYSITFYNCKFVSDLNAAVGIGCRHNQTIEFNNCYLETKAHKLYSGHVAAFIDSGALLFHNDAAVSGATDTGALILNNCEMKGTVKAIMVQSMENGSKMTVRFNKCLAYVNDGQTDNIVGYWGLGEKGTTPYFCGTDVILDKMSYGNNSQKIDFANYWN